MADFEKMAPNAERAADLLQTMANKNRLMLLCQLIGGEQSVGDLTNASGLRQATVSQHLAKLRSQSLVRTRREAQSIYYSLAGDEVRAVIATLYALYCASETERSDVVTALDHIISNKD
jgi:DNA-binding transcriptional ArsR family regulator